MIDLVGLTVAYRGRPALRDVDLHISRGERVAPPAGARTTEQRRGSLRTGYPV